MRLNTLYFKPTIQVVNKFVRMANLHGAGVMAQLAISVCKHQRPIWMPIHVIIAPLSI